VLAKKLMDVVTKDVSVGPEEVEAAYIKKYGHLSKKPTLEEVRDELAVELLRQKKDEAMKLWWRERYKEAQIEIKDERFAGVTAILNK